MDFCQNLPLQSYSPSPRHADQLKGRFVLVVAMSCRSTRLSVVSHQCGEHWDALRHAARAHELFGAVLGPAAGHEGVFFRRLARSPLGGLELLHQGREFRCRSPPPPLGGNPIPGAGQPVGCRASWVPMHLILGLG